MEPVLHALYYPDQKELQAANFTVIATNNDKSLWIVSLVQQEHSKTVFQKTLITPIPKMVYPKSKPLILFSYPALYTVYTSTALKILYPPPEDFFFSFFDLDPFHSSELQATVHFGSRESIRRWHALEFVYGIKNYFPLYERDTIFKEVTTRTVGVVISVPPAVIKIASVIFKRGNLSFRSICSSAGFTQLYVQITNPNEILVLDEIAESGVVKHIVLN